MFFFEVSKSLSQVLIQLILNLTITFIDIFSKITNITNITTFR